MPKNPIFGKHQIAPGEHHFFSDVNFLIGVKREKEGWILLNIENPAAERPEDTDFSEGEYFQTGKSNSFFIAPAFPEKPLVFKGSKLHVSPGQKLAFFLKIPLAVQVYFSKIQPENLLKEFPVRRLSDTWFGEPFSGEPAFSLGSDFSLTMEKIEPAVFETICPISIYNNSPGVLEVERLIIRVENLAIYRNEGKLITSQVAIEYKGKDSISSASYHYSKNIHGEKAEILLKPRAESSKNLLKINFHFIKNLYKSEG
ncbi:MAG: DUF432 domain-containing protein [Mariniphaga sp.]|jgi:hypothetical protein|nr:DUF432 domain-containing protein [Mariniphaga sp.]